MNRWLVALGVLAAAGYFVSWILLAIEKIRKCASRGDILEVLAGESFRALLILAGFVFAFAYREREARVNETMLEVAQAALKLAQNAALAPLLDALHSDRAEIRHGAIQRLCTFDFDSARQIVSDVARRDASPDLRGTAKRCLEIAAATGAPEARGFAQRNLAAAVAESALRDSPPVAEQLRLARQFSMRSQYREAAEAYMSLLKALPIADASGIAAQLNAALIKRGQEEFAAGNVELAEHAFKQAFVDFGD